MLFPLHCYGFLHLKIFHVYDHKTCIEESGIDSICIICRDKLFLLLYSYLMFLCYTPLDCIFILFATILHEEVLTWISFACSGAALCCRCVCTGLCENRLCVSEFRPVLYGSDCSVQTHPHCRLLFVGLHDLQTELAVALFLPW